MLGVGFVGLSLAAWRLVEISGHPGWIGLCVFWAILAIVALSVIHEEWPD